MAGNILLLQSVSSGATTLASHTTIGADNDARLYTDDPGGVPLKLSARQLIATANATGNSILTFAPNANELYSVVTISGAASMRYLVLDVTGRLLGDVIRVRVNTGMVAGVTIDVDNATTGGGSLIGGVFTTNGTGTDNLCVSAWFDGTAWHPLGVIYPTI